MTEPLFIDRKGLEEWLSEATGKAADPVAGLYGPDSMMWRINKETITFLNGGRAALLQLAHPWIANAIDQHSATRHDPVGRFNRTFINVFTMLFGNLDQVARVSRRVHHIHSAMKGEIPENSGAFKQGSYYQANEAHSMMWVHATLWAGSVEAYEWVFPKLSKQELEQYYQETKLFAYLFGIPDEILPPDWGSFMEYCQNMYESDVLKVGAIGKEMGEMIFDLDVPYAKPALNWVNKFTAEIMPDRLREEFGMPASSAESHAWFARQMKMIKMVYPRLPKRVRYLPPYVEARRRIAGYRHADVGTRLLNRMWLRMPELVSEN